MNDDEFISKLQETENQIDGINRYVSSIKLGVDFSNLNNFKPNFSSNENKDRLKPASKYSDPLPSNFQVNPVPDNDYVFSYKNQQDTAHKTKSSSKSPFDARRSTYTHSELPNYKENNKFVDSYKNEFYVTETSNKRELEKQYQSKLKDELTKLKDEFSRKHYEELEEVHNMYKTKLSQLNESISNQYQQAENTRRKSSELYQQLTKLKKLEYEIQSLKEELESKTIKLDLLSKKNATLERQVDDLESANHDYTQKIAVLETSNSTFKEQLYREQKGATQNYDNLQTLQQQVTTLTNKLNRLETDYERLLSEKLEKDQQANYLKSELSNERLQSMRLQEDYSYRIKTLEDELLKVNVKLHESEVREKEKHMQSEMLKKDLDHYKGRECSLSKELQILSQKLVEKEEKAKEFIQLRRELEQSSLTVENLKVEINMLNKDLNSTQKELDQRTVEAKQKSNDILKLTQELVKAKKDLDNSIRSQGDTRPLGFSKYTAPVKQNDSFEDVDDYKCKTTFPTSSNVNTHNLEKQLILLQCEKTEIEGVINRFPRNTLGTLRNKELKQRYEDRYDEINKDIQKIKHELRLAGCKT